MRKRICGILVARQLMGLWLAAAQTNTHPNTKQQSYGNQVNTGLVAAAGTGRANPAIAVSARTLDFGPVEVGKRRNLTFTLQNAGAGTVTGEAKVCAPFRI